MILVIILITVIIGKTIILKIITTRITMIKILIR